MPLIKIILVEKPDKDVQVLINSVECEEKRARGFLSDQTRS